MKIFNKVLDAVLLFIEREYKSENLFVCISGLEAEVVKYAKDNIDAFRDGFDSYCILPLYVENYEFSFDEVVKARNNKNIPKIVILTNGSIKSIDSLKDFNQMDFKDVEYGKFWDIIVEINKDFSWLTQNKYIKNFFANIKEIVKPEMSKLISYIEKANESYENYNNIGISLNSNLHELGMWSSASDEILKKTKLRAIYNNSSPTQIQRKIKSARDIDNIQKRDMPENLKGRFKDMKRQKEILKKMFYFRSYADAIREVCYEHVEQIMKGGGRKKKVKTQENENDQEYTNIYEIALSELVGEDDIKVDISTLLLEEKNLPNVQQLNGTEELSTTIKIKYRRQDKELDKTVHVYFEKAQKIWQDFHELFGNCIEKDEFTEKILQQGRRLNLPQGIKQELMDVLEGFCSARRNFLNNIVSPISLCECLDKSSVYIEAFFKIIKFIFALDDNYVTSITESELISHILNVDVIMRNDELLVPYYNPLIILHMRIMKSRMEEALDNINQINSYRAKILEYENKNLHNYFFVYEKRLYALSSSNDSFPYYAKYIPYNKIDSLCNIDSNSLYQYLISYAEKYPYKNELRICLIGNIDINALKVNLTRLLKKAKETNLKSFKLELLVKDKNKIKDNLLGSIESQELIKNYLEFQIDFLDENLDFANYLNSIIKDTDIVAFLDSSIMYLEPTFDIQNNDKLLISFKHRSLTNEVNSFNYVSRGQKLLVPLLPNIIDTLQNSLFSKKLDMGEWYKYKLDSQVIAVIGDVIRNEYGDKSILLFSSKMDIDEQLFDCENIIRIDEDKSENRNIKIIEWQKNKSDSKIANIPLKANKVIEFRAEELINNFYNYFEQDEQDNTKKFAELMFTMDYCGFPDNIIFGSYFINKKNKSNSNDEDNLSDNIKNIVEEIYKSFIKCAVSPKTRLDYYFKENLVNVLLKNIKCIEDITFVYLFSSINNENINISEDVIVQERYDVREERESISALSRNNIYTILKYIGAENMTQKRMSILRKKIKTTNISYEQINYVLDFAEQFQHDDIKYLVDNIPHVRKELEVMKNEI